MIVTQFNRRRAERFAQLLDEANGGRRHHIRSRLDRDLTDLVVLGNLIRTTTPVVTLEPEFRAGLRAMLLATGERDGIGVARADALAVSPGPRRATPVGPATTRRPTGGDRRARTRTAIILGVAAGTIAVSGISAASEDAVPGDTLYSMKRQTERAQLALTSSDVSRGTLFLDFARTRLVEAGAVRHDPVGFAAALDDMDSDTREGVRLLATTAVQQDSPTALEPVRAFLAAQRRAVADLVAATSATQRIRAQASLTLLSVVAERADGLRAALRCAAGPAVRLDALGPVPRSCPQPAARPAGGLDRSPTLGPRPTQTGPTHSDSSGSVVVPTDQTPEIDLRPRLVNPANSGTEPG